MGASNMPESDAVRLAQDYANENGIKEGIERVSFVDADGLPPDGLPPEGAIHFPHWVNPPRIISRNPNGVVP